jgi:hypothetical protein
MTDRVPLDTADLAGALAERATTPEWRGRLGALARGDHDGALRLAVLREPFLGLMLSGRRTLESRFSRNRIAPYRAIRPGDVVALQGGVGAGARRGGSRGRALLMRVGQPQRVAPTEVAKSDRRAWVTLDRTSPNVICP